MTLDPLTLRPAPATISMSPAESRALEPVVILTAPVEESALAVLSVAVP